MLSNTILFRQFSSTVNPWNIFFAYLSDKIRIQLAGLGAFSGMHSPFHGRVSHVYAMRALENVKRVIATWYIAGMTSFRLRPSTVRQFEGQTVNEYGSFFKSDYTVTVTVQGKGPKYTTIGAWGGYCIA